MTKSMAESWNIPDKTPRQAQLTAFEFLEKNYKDKKYFFLEIPTGGGKSIIAKIFAEYSKQFKADRLTGMYLTHQKILQRQYEKEFSDIFSFSGRSNYKCATHISNCEIGSIANGCRGCAGCPATAAVDRALETEQIITNYAMALTISDRLARRDVVILDEAHQLESILCEFNTVTITVDKCDKLGLDYPKFVDKTRMIKWVLGEYRTCIDKWVVALDEEIEPYRLARMLTNEQRDNVKQFKELSSELDLISSMSMVDANELILTSTDNSVTLKFLFGAYNFNKLVKPLGDKFLIMSATLGNWQIMASTLGIPEDECCFLSLDSEFPVENRPVVYKPIGKVNYQFMQNRQLQEQLVDTVIETLKNHTSENGIIHTGNYQIARLLVEKLSGNIKHKIYHHNPSAKLDRNKVIDQFLVTTRPSILISPSANEGLSCDDDIARFGIIVKLPYLFLGDQWVKARLDLSNSWYSNECLKTVMQSVGRTTRSSTDHSVNYILDGCWDTLYKQTANSIPAWFKAAIV